MGLPSRQVQFPTTCWTLLCGGDGADTARRMEAFASQSERYWYPFYAFLRRSGHPREVAQDLTQGFFSHLLSGDRFASLEKERGRFRCYLLGCLKNYVSGVRRKEAAAKRGGGQLHVPIDAGTAETRYQNEPAAAASPDLLYDKRWAEGVMADAGERLREHYEETGKGDVFAAIWPLVSTGHGGGGYRSAADSLGTSEGNARQLASRMRARFREALVETVADTVATRAEIDDEVRHLLAVLA